MNHNLDKVFPLILSLKYDNTFTPLEGCDYDDYGLERSFWTKWSIENKRSYFNHLFRQFRKFNKSTLKAINDPSSFSVIYDTVDSDGPENVFKNIRQEINSIIRTQIISREYPRYKEFADDCIGIIYNKNSLHRDRYIFLMNHKAIFFVPPRKLGYKAAWHFPPSILAKNMNIQDPIVKEMTYNRLNTYAEGYLAIKDNCIVFKDDSILDKAIESENLNSFLIWLTFSDNKTFVDLFKFHPVPHA